MADGGRVSKGVSRVTDREKTFVTPIDYVGPIQCGMDAYPSKLPELNSCFQSFITNILIRYNMGINGEPN
jgi:hypothetical protein